MKIFNFSGRARRRETLTIITAPLIMIITSFIIGESSIAADSNLNYFLLFLVVAAIPLALLAPISCIRRMHDIDKSGWFSIIPVVGTILILFPGTPGPNRFGPDPRNPEAKESQHPAQVNQHLPQQRVSQHGTPKLPVQQGRNIPGL